jgi:cytidine kinase
MVAAIRDLQAMVKPTGPRIVLLKKGEHGCLAAIGDELFSLPAYPTSKLVDPTGAGDSFAGGLLGFLASKDQYDVPTLKSAIAAGTIMASFTIEAFSLDGLLAATPDAIQRRMTEYKKMLAL